MARLVCGILVAVAVAACSSQQAAKTQSDITTQTKRSAGAMNRAIQSVATTDTRLKVEVTAAIAAQAGVNVFHVSTGVRDGVVTLSGTVPNVPVQQSIVKAAAGVAGVKRVINRMHV